MSLSALMLVIGLAFGFILGTPIFFSGHILLIVFSITLFILWFLIFDADVATFMCDLHRSFFVNPNTDLYFTDKVVWVIGSSSGIGEYLIYELVRSGCKTIILSSRRKPHLLRVQQQALSILAHENELNQTSRQINIFIKTLDLMDFASKDDFNERFIKDLMLYASLNPNMYSDIDIVIMNSGVIQTGYAVDNNLRFLKYMMDVNTIAPISLIQAMINYWTAANNSNNDSNSINSNNNVNNNSNNNNFYQNEGSSNGNVNSNSNNNNNNGINIHRKHYQIAFTSSIAGKLGSPVQSAYSMSKFAIDGYIQAWRTEVMDDNITFHVIYPGDIQIAPFMNDGKGSSRSESVKRGSRTPTTNNNNNNMNNNIQAENGEWDSTNVNESLSSSQTKQNETRMSLERCAHLYVSMLRYSIPESVVSWNPVLLFTYLKQYLPAIVFYPFSNFIVPHIIKDYKKMEIL